MLLLHWPKGNIPYLINIQSLLWTIRHGNEKGSGMMNWISWERGNHVVILDINQTLWKAFFFRLFLFMCMYVSLHGFLGTVWVPIETRGWQVPWSYRWLWVLEIEPGPLQEQHTISTSEPFLQPQVKAFNEKSVWILKYVHKIQIQKLEVSSKMPIPPVSENKTT